MDWSPVIKELIALLKKFGGAIGAWAAGFFTGKRRAEDSARKRADKADEKQEERDREFEALDRDTELTDDMRELRKRLASGDGAVQK